MLTGMLSNRRLVRMFWVIQFTFYLASDDTAILQAQSIFIVSKVKANHY